jgi:hypothetical protein
MTQEAWNKLSFFEQMSNIDGDVERMIRAHQKYIAGESKEDNGFFYLDKIDKLVRMTLHSPENASKGYRGIELFDEIGELRKYLAGEYDDDYVRNYWNQYTNAIS